MKEAGIQRLFVLSPASCSGRRADILLRDQANFDLAIRLRTDGVTLGEVFSFLSGLYFRGKMAYASRFGTAADGAVASSVITAGRGLMSPQSMVKVSDLQEFASIAIDLKESRYREPLERDATSLAQQLTPNCQIVLLGSIATAKYRDILHQALGERLHFPTEFIGRGDMSRGGLMLRCVQEGRELHYQPIDGAKLRGPRPPKLPPHP